MHRSKILHILFIALSISSCDKAINSVNNAEIVAPGRRDYVWSVDSLKIATYDYFVPIRIWGSSPANVWITGIGGRTSDLLWHYDGIQWTKDSLPRNISPSSLWGTSADNVWMGNNNNSIWRFDGSQWFQFGTYRIAEYANISFNDIWGLSPDNLWGVGFAAQQTNGTDYRGIIVHFDGSQWQFATIPVTRTSFEQVRQESSTGMLFLRGYQYEPTGGTDKLYTFDGKVLKEIYSSQTANAYVMAINGEIYLSLGQAIYKYKDNQLHLMVDLSSTLFPGARHGRSEKDIFTNGEGGLGHYNGSDFKIIYEIPPNARIGDILLFESEVFFMCYTADFNSGIVMHGKLPQK